MFWISNMHSIGKLAISLANWVFEMGGKISLSEENFHAYLWFGKVEIWGAWKKITLRFHRKFVKFTLIKGRTVFINKNGRTFRLRDEWISQYSWKGKGRERKVIHLSHHFWYLYFLSLHFICSLILSPFVNLFEFFLSFWLLCAL